MLAASHVPGAAVAPPSRYGRVVNRGVSPLASTGPVGRQRLALATVFAVAVLAGVCAGVSGAALGLALIGKSVAALTVEQAETLLVVGPLAGLLPLAWLLQATRRGGSLVQVLPAALGAWVASASVSFIWLGISPLLR